MSHSFHSPKNVLMYSFMQFLYHTYLIIYHIFRYGKLLFPTHSRPTAGLLLPLVWVVSLLLVLPYTSHIRHEHLATGLELETNLREV